jgi:hypothetical protein
MTSPGAAISSRLRSWIGPAGERGERDCREPAHHRGACAAANERHREHEHTNAAQI